MDNDYQIIDNNKSGTSIVKYLLKDELEAISKDTQDLYDLEKEYAKTKLNRTYFVPKVLLACVIFVVLITLVICFGITKFDQNIAVNIDVFQDVDIKGMLDLSARTDASYQQAVKAHNELEASLDFALKEALQKKDEDLFMLNSMRLKKTKLNQRKKEIEDDYLASCKAIHNEYDIKLEASNKDVKHFKALLDEYNTGAAKNVQGKLSSLNSERQLHQLEIDRITKGYESQIKELENRLDKKQRDSLDRQKKSVSTVTKNFEERLDPIIKDDMALSLRKLYNANTVLPFNSFSYKNQLLEKNKKTDFTVALDEINENEAQAYNYIKDSILTTALQDHQNSIPDYWNLQNKITTRIIDKIATSAIYTINIYAQDLNTANNQLEAYQDHFEAMCQVAGDDTMGIIIDSTNINSMLIYIKKTFTPKIEDLPIQANVVRGQSTNSLCKLMILIEKGILIARPYDEENLLLAQKNKITTGDKILLEFPSPTPTDAPIEDLPIIN